MNPYAAPEAEETPARAGTSHAGTALATLGKRFAGALIDTIVTTVVALVLSAMLRTMTGMPNVLTRLYLASLAVHAVQWILLYERGQTIGKMWLGMKVVRRDGGRVGFVDAVALRAWPLVALGAVPLIDVSLRPLVMLFSLADALAIFAGSERRTLHDRIAGTKVIDLGPRL